MWHELPTDDDVMIYDDMDLYYFEAGAKKSDRRLDTICEEVIIITSMPQTRA